MRFDAVPSSCLGVVAADWHMDWRCLPLHGAPQHLLPRGDDSGPGDVRRARSGGAGGVRRLQSQLAGRGSEPAERWQLGLRPHARRAAGGASGESGACWSMRKHHRVIEILCVRM